MIEHPFYERTKAIFIGINQYEKMQHLSGSVNDAIEMKKVFDSLGFESLDPLLNKNATKRGIEEYFEELRKKLLGKDENEIEENKDSLVVIFMSGHGGENKKGNQPYYYFCPHDFDQQNFFPTSIDLLGLTNKIRAFNCKHVLFILDCCFSGGIFSKLVTSP